MTTVNSTYKLKRRSNQLLRALFSPSSIPSTISSTILGTILSTVFLVSSNTVYAANTAPKLKAPQLIVYKENAPLAIGGIVLEDDSDEKLKLIISIPAESGSISAKSAASVTAKNTSLNVLELTGTAKQLNSYFNTAKLLPIIKPTSSQEIEVSYQVTDQGQGKSKSGVVSLAEISGSAAINTAPKGWELASHTPDIINGNGPWPGGNYEITHIEGGPSPFGGNMGMFLERADGSTPAEAWKTQLSGLTKGENYSFIVAWQQATVKRMDGTGPIYSGGTLKVTVDGKEFLFKSDKDAATDTWQEAEIKFTAESANPVITVGVLSNTQNKDGESIVVDTGIKPLMTAAKSKTKAIVQVANAEKAESSANANTASTPSSSNEPVKSAEVTKKKVPVTPYVAKDTPAASGKAKTSTTTSSSAASTGKLSSSVGSVPEPSLDILPSIVNTQNVSEVAVTGSCIAGATIQLSCFASGSKAPLSPLPNTTCATSNAYSINVNMQSLADDTIECTAQQSVGADTSAASNKDVVVKATANMSVAGVTTLEAPTVGVPYKQTIRCTNNGISTAQNASCALSGLPSWASNTCSAATSSVKPGESLICEISGVPTNATPINALASTGAKNDDMSNNNTGKISSSTGTVPAPILAKLPTSIGSDIVTGLNIAGTCTPNATVTLSCSNQLSGTNQLGTTPTVTCGDNGQFNTKINTSNLSDGLISCQAQQTLGSTNSPLSLPVSATKATAIMSVPSNTTLAAPIVGSPYNQTIACTNTGSSPAVNATCTIKGLPDWASVSCSPTPPTLVPVGGSIQCRISGTPTSAAPIMATISTSASNNEEP